MSNRGRFDADISEEPTPEKNKKRIRSANITYDEKNGWWNWYVSGTNGLGTGSGGYNSFFDAAAGFTRTLMRLLMRGSV